MGITNYFINTVITAFHAPEWAMLLDRWDPEVTFRDAITQFWSFRIGEDAMLHLLVETSIFVALPNGCLCQLSGEPVIYMTPRIHDEQTLDPEKSGKPTQLGGKRPRLISDGEKDERPKKRQKLDGPAANHAQRKSVPRKRCANS